MKGSYSISDKQIRDALGHWAERKRKCLTVEIPAPLVPRDRKSASQSELLTQVTTRGPALSLMR